MMPPTLALPQSTADLIHKVPVAHRHPGLQLDKLSVAYEQTEQKKALEQVIDTDGDPALLNALWQRRHAMLSTLPGIHWWRCRTTGSFTLHLSRASALENAGICLHPLYGFVYLPGSGLKGIARAYAKTLWLPTQADRHAAWRTIEDVFGWAPNRDRQKQLRAADHPATQRHVYDNDPLSPAIPAHTGAIVFQEAWPETWPRLVLDIVNNHHGEYYRHDTQYPPGDWENPVPVYFLAVAVGTTFTFAVSKRRSDVSDYFVDMARQWLISALCFLGAGAKTAAGYGSFALLTDSEESKQISETTRATWTRVVQDGTRNAFHARLTIVSPAFLGGADNTTLDPAQPLRPASIKGMLRFWWRALHGDWPLSKLRETEARIFGDTEQGQGLRVIVQAQNCKKLARGFDAGKGGSPLGYLGYGPIQYDSNARGNRSNRDAIDKDSTFEVTLIHRDPDALTEAVQALWLFGALGGIGSRARRGWGSVSIAPAGENKWPRALPDLCQTSTPEILQRLVEQGLDTLIPQSIRQPAPQLQWTAIGKHFQLIVSKQSFTTWREALEAIASTFQAFRNRYGLNRSGVGGPGPDYHHSKAILQLTNLTNLPRLPERAGFGLPYAQEYRSLRQSQRFFRVEYIIVPKQAGDDAEGRRASPLMIKLLPVANNRVAWIVTFLPAKFAPDDHEIRVKRSELGNNNRPVKYRLSLSSPPSIPESYGIPGGQAGTTASAHSNVQAGSTLVLDFLRHLQGSPVTPPRPQGTVRPPTPTPPSRSSQPSFRQARAVPVNKGQTRQGTLRRKEDKWVAILAGDEREAVITNPEKLPPHLQDGGQGEFYVEEASKRIGIRARFNKAL